MRSSEMIMKTGTICFCRIRSVTGLFNLFIISLRLYYYTGDEEKKREKPSMFRKHGEEYVF